MSSILVGNVSASESKLKCSRNSVPTFVKTTMFYFKTVNDWRVCCKVPRGFFYQGKHKEVETDFSSTYVGKGVGGPDAQGQILGDKIRRQFLNKVYRWKVLGTGFYESSAFKILPPWLGFCFCFGSCERCVHQSSSPILLATSGDR
mmetsp:Transcript_17827/g.38807  ORF Transcript_17827/g.38807 Transcript_17827/m.38807 type:complete len:146 (-) Transcript_17827:31-468(-)